MRTNLATLAFLCLLASCAAGSPPAGPWMGQTPPGGEPVLFGPGTVSTGLYERDFASTTDGKEFFFTIMGADYSVIASCREEQGVWKGPFLVPFTAQAPSRDFEPFLSHDGKRLFFASTRPSGGRPAKPGWVYQDIWVTERTTSGWSEPRNLGAPIDSEDPEFYPSLTREGTLYFTRGKEGKEESAIYRARPRGEGWGEPERLPAAINTGAVFNACIAPDESYLLFCAGGRPGCVGGADYFVCFRTADDRWSEAVNLGPAFNRAGQAAIAISVTPDGKRIFFSSARRVSGGRSNPPIYEELQKERQMPGNGNSDIYWVDASVLDALRPVGFERR